MEPEETVICSYPIRSFMDDPCTVWVYGNPNYDIVNKKYIRERTKVHKEGSLEQKVENLVKTWEMESFHKARIEDWKTIDRDNYSLCINGGRPFNFEDNIALGSYNMLLDGCPLYDTKQHSRSASIALFKKAFPGGFAWEVLAVQSGPPVVSFTWHHWAKWEGAYGDVPPTGEEFELYGSCVTKMDDNQKIQSIEVFYDPNPMMAKLTGFRAGVTRCPFST